MVLGWKTNSLHTGLTFEADCLEPPHHPDTKTRADVFAALVTPQGLVWISDDNS